MLLIHSYCNTRSICVILSTQMHIRLAKITNGFSNIRINFAWVENQKHFFVGRHVGDSESIPEDDLLIVLKHK